MKTGRPDYLRALVTGMMLASSEARGELGKHTRGVSTGPVRELKALATQEKARDRFLAELVSSYHWQDVILEWVRIEASRQAAQLGRTAGWHAGLGNVEEAVADAQTLVHVLKWAKENGGLAGKKVEEPEATA